MYIGDQPLGARDLALTGFGTKEGGDSDTCELGFYGATGNRRGLDTCALFSGVDSPPPNKPSDSNGAATWVQYQSALDTWAQKNAPYLLVSQQQELQSLCANAGARVQASGLQPAPGADSDAVTGEEWPTWADGAAFPRYPAGDATAQVWRTIKQQTVV